jgi:hypothetical protein
MSEPGAMGRQGEERGDGFRRWRGMARGIPARFFLCGG